MQEEISDFQRKMQAEMISEAMRKYWEDPNKEKQYFIYDPDATEEKLALKRIEEELEAQNKILETDLSVSEERKEKLKLLSSELMEIKEYEGDTLIKRMAKLKEQVKDWVI